MNSLSTSLLNSSDIKQTNKMNENHYAHASSLNDAYSKTSLKPVPEYENFNTKQTNFTGNDTLESSHSESDDAKGPEFPPDVYGSNYSFEEHNQRRGRNIGIYGRRDLQENAASKGFINNG